MLGLAKKESNDNGNSRSLRDDKKSNVKGNDKMRGSLHCATHDQTVSGFGRDDRGWVGRETSGTI
jgi:hypothetical protein